MHILIADDVDDNREPLRHYFRLFTDWSVVFAESGEDALFKYSAEFAAGRPFDCVVLDIAMPDISGLKVAQVIREAGDDVPIVFFTAYDRAANRHGAEDVGASYLTKPVSPMDLQGVVQSLVDDVADLPDGE